jgi:hypothetical protein
MTKKPPKSLLGGGGGGIFGFSLCFIPQEKLTLYKVLMEKNSFYCNFCTLYFLQTNVDHLSINEWRLVALLALYDFSIVSF